MRGKFNGYFPRIEGVSTAAPDLQALLHPAQAFAHPDDVVGDPDLTLQEKRAILASWASDACAVEAAPDLRRPPGADRPVRFDDIMDALRQLDGPTEDRAGREPARRARRNVLRPWQFGRGQTGGGSGRALN